jgi:hypothetical protein
VLTYHLDVSTDVALLTNTQKRQCVVHDPIGERGDTMAIREEDE